LNLRRFDAAAAAFNRALAIKPDMAEVLAHRGRMHLQLARFAEATADFNAALALSPELEAAWRGLAQVAILTGKITQAMVACKRVLAQNPNCETGLTLLGTCLGSQGETASAIAHFDRALAIKPDYEEAITKKIFALDFLPDADFAIQQAARRYWWDAIGARIPQRQLSPRQLDPNRRLVVGYVSSDFRSHSAAFAFMPVLRHHDRTNFSVVCYACSPQQDAVTEGLRAYADIWVDAWHLPDDDLADRIQADNVDILVDLSGHTAGHRLPVFARKPAPVQVTAWGSGTGTGLPTMDYFLADPVTVPQSVRHFFAERVYDLPSVITMEPIRDMRPSAPPMIRNGYITFGVFNRIDKISEAALKVWAKLLQAVVGSKIIVKHGALDDELVRDGLIARFVAQGVSLDSITCIGATWRGEHLSTFEKVDISLDPFPQNGGISTWESLYMGVPVVAKLGNGASSRAAGAILKAIGLDDWVAEDDDGYIAIARKFASMPSHLEKLRAELPAKIASSAAGNVETYTCKVEEGYRQFWRGYCAEASEAGAKP
ncbi:MAG: tetratricopeptide repeat protein, partial [Bradyrhizobium sp.]